MLRLFLNFVFLTYSFKKVPFPVFLTFDAQVNGNPFSINFLLDVFPFFEDCLPLSKPSLCMSTDFVAFKFVRVLLHLELLGLKIFPTSCYDLRPLPVAGLPPAPAGRGLNSCRMYFQTVHGSGTLR